jgi:hypothetical protein
MISNGGEIPHRFSRRNRGDVISQKEIIFAGGVSNEHQTLK